MMGDDDLHVTAAGADDAMSGDERRFIRSKEQRDVSDLLLRALAISAFLPLSLTALLPARVNNIRTGVSRNSPKALPGVHNPHRRESQ